MLFYSFGCGDIKEIFSIYISFHPSSSLNVHNISLLNYAGFERRISWHVSDYEKEFPSLDCKDYRSMNMQRRQLANNARCYKTFHIPQFHTLYRGNSTKNRRQVVRGETSRIPQTNPRTLIRKIQSPIHVCTAAQHLP